MAQSRIIVYGNSCGALAAALEAARAGAPTYLVGCSEPQTLTTLTLPDKEAADTPKKRFLAGRLEDTLGFLQRLNPQMQQNGLDCTFSGDLGAILAEKAKSYGVTFCDIIGAEKEDYCIFTEKQSIASYGEEADYNRRIVDKDLFPFPYLYNAVGETAFDAITYGRIAGAHAALTALGLPNAKTYLRRRLRAFRSRPALVRSPEEARKILSAGAGVFSNLTVFGFLYRTTKEFAKSVLPAPFEVDDDPRVGLYICDSDTYAGFVAQLTCLYHGHPTKYALGYVMESDTSTMYGQTFLGEPKKVGDITLELKGNKAYGKVVRHGEVICEMSGELSNLTKLDNYEKPNLDFGFPEGMFYRYHFKPDGSGVENLQLIGLKEVDVMQEKAAVNNGILKMFETTDDIYGQIPLTERIHGAYVTFDQYICGEEFPCEITEEEFLPYALYKHDDYREMGTLGDYIFHTPCGFKK